MVHQNSFYWQPRSLLLLLSRFSRVRLCVTPRDGSPLGSPVPGILQARTLEWAAISFSNAWKWKLKVKSLSRVRLLATPWSAAYQAPPSMGFSRQEYWSGVPVRKYFYSTIFFPFNKESGFLHQCFPSCLNNLQQLLTFEWNTSGILPEPAGPSGFLFFFSPTQETGWQRDQAEPCFKRPLNLLSSHQV